MRFVSALILFVMLFVASFGGSLLANDEQATNTDNQVSPVVERMNAEFMMTIGDHFNVPYEDVADVIDLGISNDDLAVIFFIANKANVEAMQVAMQRQSGENWYQIYESHGLRAGHFFVQLNADNDKRLFGRLVGLHKGQWTEKLILRNAEVTNLVNISVLNAAFPDNKTAIASSRASGENFAYLHYKSAAKRAYNHKIELAAEMDEE